MALPHHQKQIESLRSLKTWLLGFKEKLLGLKQEVEGLEARKVQLEKEIEEREARLREREAESSKHHEALQGEASEIADLTKEVEGIYESLRNGKLPADQKNTSKESSAANS